MSGFEFDVSDFVAKMSGVEARAIDSGLQGVQDALDHVDRIASNIAPLDDSVLRKSSKKTTGLKGNGDIVGELTFSAIEKHGNKKFNYAYWIHEMDYELGPKSKGGTDGYAVGNKYVERPMKGESEKIVKDWASSIARGMGNL